MSRDITPCPGWDLNPHAPFGAADFKSATAAKLRHPGLEPGEQCATALPSRLLVKTLDET